MFDVATAGRWGATPDFPKAMRHWTWCREQLPQLLRHLTQAETGGVMPTVDMAALARAYWAWASRLDNEARFEPLDPVDFAHYACGVFLANTLTDRPLPATGPDPEPGIRVLTRAALTLLAAWRQALGQPLTTEHIDEKISAEWPSYLENIARRPQAAIAFLDLFTGCEPAWQYPLQLVERPAFHRALVARRNLRPD